MVQSISVVIMDDHAMLAESLRAALAQTPDIRVLHVERTLTGGLDAVARLAPDIALMDLRLPDGEAAHGIALLAQRGSAARAVVVSGDCDDRAVIQALDAGAYGFLLTDQRFDELVDAIRTAHQGRIVLAPALIARLARARQAPPPPRLSRREVEVLQEVATGASAPVIAQRLYVSPNTVRNHVQSILTRLGAHSKIEAVSIALRDGLIALPVAGVDEPAR